jgi:putative restriction endonuclease
MRFWWVNQNQTFEHEVAGGYLWSPKFNQNGNRNPFYEFMKEVVPGDVVFSFAGTRIPAMGIVASHAYEAPKPLEFGQTGAYWDKIGWRVDVRFTALVNTIRPADHIDRLRPYLPGRYSPLQSTGAGMQGVYLTSLPELLAHQLIDLIGSEARAAIQSWRVNDVSEDVFRGQAEWEEHQIEIVRQGPAGSTEKLALILARQGQGMFRDRVARIERKCRVTGIAKPEHLRASHTKPWRDATDEERLDGENGFLLSPDVDHLFDRGFLSFEDSGKVLVSPVADTASLDRMGLAIALSGNVGAFSDGQRKYLNWHRENIFLEARVNRAP